MDFNLYHRTDCCQDRLIAANIWVSTGADYAASGIACSASTDGGNTAQPEVGTCGGAMGQFITVAHAGDFITICEFEAMGVAPPRDSSAACGPRGSDNLAVPGQFFVQDGESFSYVQGSTDYTNCVWTMQCPGGDAGSVTFTSFASEGGWDFLNVFSDASLITNSIGPAANNGGVDNSGDLGRFSGSQDPGTIAGVAAVQFISDWSVIGANAGFSASLTC